MVESEAGSVSGCSDQARLDTGAEIGEGWDADVVLKVNSLSYAEITRLRQGATVVALPAPGQRPELFRTLADAGMTVLALDAVPRIQSMDVVGSWWLEGVPSPSAV
ncbi:hypothetical protein AB5J72_01650 [Streptomyces sp. CG1]|uniref:hypothetical protein n=1 Tax=Streptomyces sp. CG1 TaxID=1287523 RepID=UPI0034E1AC6F